MDEYVVQALRRVIDPELGINVVDLGLVYSAERQGSHVRVAMTVTTPGCPLASQIMSMAEAAIWQHVSGVQSVNVELVWSPRWQRTMMSEEAKDQLGWL